MASAQPVLPPHLRSRTGRSLTRTRTPEGTGYYVEDFAGIRLDGRGDLFRMMSLARAMAFQSRHPIRVGAVLTKRGRIISTGYNHSVRTHPQVSTRFNTVHAEMDAIIGSDRDLFRGSTVWVYRERADGSVGRAKPCIDCHRHLAHLGVKWAVYTDPETGFDVQRL